MDKQNDIGNGRLMPYRNLIKTMSKNYTPTNKVYIAIDKAVGSDYGCTISAEIKPDGFTAILTYKIIKG